MSVEAGRAFVSTKRSLLALSHAMERSLEVGRCGDARNGELLIGLFQRAEYFEPERERYASIAADGALCIVGFVGPAADLPAGVAAVALDEDEDLAAEWSVVVIDGALGTALVAHEVQDRGEDEPPAEASREFTAEWSFSPVDAGREATRILGMLGDRLDAEVRTRAGAAIEVATATEPNVTERRLAAVTELLVTRIDTAYTRSASLRAQLGRERELSQTDPLTGLQNRRFLKSYLDSAEGDPSQGLAALLVDLDRLKAINDDNGHGAGDAALVALAGVLRDVTRPHDVVVRLGGDEFLVVLPGLDADEAVRVGERIVDQIATTRLPEPWSEVRVSASIGVAMVRSRTVPMDLLDEALYVGKRSGGGRVTRVDPAVSRPGR